MNRSFVATDPNYPRRSHEETALHASTSGYVFLASDESRFVSGEILAITGGLVTA